MPATENEALAGLRVLVAVAKSDGRVDADERRALDDAFSRVPNSGGADLDRLLDEAVDIDAELAWSGPAL